MPEHPIIMSCLVPPIMVTDLIQNNDDNAITITQVFYTVVFMLIDSKQLLHVIIELEVMCLTLS